MTNSLDLEIHYSVDDYVRGLTFIQSRSLFFRYGFIIVPSILIAFILVQFFLNRDSISQMSPYYTVVTFAPIFAIVAVFLFLKYFPNPFLRWSVQKQFKSSPLLREAQQISFDEVGIKGQTNLSAGETRWPAIIEGTETKDDFFFFTSSKIAMFFPKDGLTVEQIEKIRELATRNLGEKANF